MKTDSLYKIFLKHPVVTTDTRVCVKDSLFFALKGANFNGNSFATLALENGCSYAIVDEEEVCKRHDSRYILVDDVLITLQRLANYHREKLKVPILQITGTNGKTTTKELTAAVLSQKYNVLYTSGNLNNHIGVPLTLLRLDKSHDFAIIETGANHPREISSLAAIVDPDYGLITNVGMAHLEGFRSFEGVVKTKGELFDYLRSRENAHIFLDKSNAYLKNIATGLRAFTYSSDPDNDAEVSGEVVECNPFLKIKWSAKDVSEQSLQTHLIGSYNINNVLAAIAIGCYFHVSEKKINNALSTYVPENNRSELLKTNSNQLIIDAYNANPTSMKAALDNFVSIKGVHKIAILGEMRELGVVSKQEHKKIIDMLPDLKLDEVFLVGSSFKEFSSVFHYFNEVDELMKYIALNPISNATILIKGSNSTKLWKLSKSL